jgi:hypothetical protein
LNDAVEKSTARAQLIFFKVSTMYQPLASDSEDDRLNQEFGHTALATLPPNVGDEGAP